MGGGVYHAGDCRHVMVSAVKIDIARHEYFCDGIQGHCPDGWVLLGVAAMQNGDRAEAVRLLSEANKREPNKKLPKQLLAAASNVAIARATP